MNRHLLLEGVARTALIPVIGRARASQNPEFAFSDPYAEQIVAALPDEEIRSIEQKSMPRGVAIREMWTDMQVQNFLQQHQKPCVVTLGSGLDSRQYRLDREHIQWYDCDLPEGIEIRKKFYNQDQRHHFISCDLTAPDFVQTLVQAGVTAPVMFYSTGVFMYIDKEPLNRMFQALTKQWPNSPITFDTCSSFFVKHAHRLAKGVEKNMMKWGIPYGSSAEDIHGFFPALSHITTTSYIKQGWVADPPHPFLKPIYTLMGAIIAKKFDSPLIAATLTPTEKD